MPENNRVASGIYGQFLGDEELVRKYDGRVDKTNEMAKGIVAYYENKYPNLNNCFSISYSNILISIGRYMNDLGYSNAAHDIDNFHRSKIVAYTIRWFLIYNPILPNVNEEKYNSLNTQERKVLFDITFTLIDCYINYIFSDARYLTPTKKDHDLKRRFRYYLKTDGYSAKMATLYLESHFG